MMTIPWVLGIPGGPLREGTPQGVAQVGLHPGVLEAPEAQGAQAGVEDRLTIGTMGHREMGAGGPRDGTRVPRKIETGATTRTRRGTNVIKGSTKMRR